MTQREKRFEKILNGSQPSYRFTDIRNFLEHHRFMAEMKGTSHCIFRREPYPHITLVVHHNQVKSFYVKRAVQIMKDYEIIP